MLFIKTFFSWASGDRITLVKDKTYISTNERIFRDNNASNGIIYKIRRHYGNCCFACNLYSVFNQYPKSLFIFKVFHSDFFVKLCNPNYNFYD